MFFLSLGLGALFLVMVHHLFDAGWSVPIRRFCEHLATLLVPLAGALLFIPIALLRKTYLLLDEIAVRSTIMRSRAKLPLFTMPMFYRRRGRLLR